MLHDLFFPSHPPGHVYTVPLATPSPSTSSRLSFILSILTTDFTGPMKLFGTQLWGGVCHFCSGEMVWNFAEKKAPHRKPAPMPVDEVPEVAIKRSELAREESARRQHEDRVLAEEKRVSHKSHSLPPSSSHTMYLHHAQKVLMAMYTGTPRSQHQHLIRPGPPPRPLRLAAKDVTQSKG